MKLKRCPFCGTLPFVGPTDPKREGNAFGYVECFNEECPAQPRVTDGADVCDERGTAAYQALAVARWNRRWAVAHFEALDKQERESMVPASEAPHDRDQKA